MAENLVREGIFFPVRSGLGHMSEILTETPALRGYVATKAKGTATVSLEVGAEHPLLASWQRGLGRVAVWTSDATSRWSSEWVEWPGFVEFWGTVVRETLPVQGDGVVSATVEGGVLSISVDQPGLPAEATGVARVRGPDGEVEVISLRRVGPDAFEAKARADTAGAYWITADVNTPRRGQKPFRRGSGLHLSGGVLLPASRPGSRPGDRRGHRRPGRPAAAELLRCGRHPGSE